MSGPAPLCLAMVICDGVYREPTTGKMFILGIFGAFQAPEFPLVVGPFAVYASLTDARGKVPIKFRIVDADDEHPAIFEQEMEADFPDPIAVLDIATMFVGVTFPAPGEYRVQLYCSGEFVIERRMIVVSTVKDQQ